MDSYKMGLKGCFRCLYGIYNSRLGRALHNCMLSNRHHRRIRGRQRQEHSHIDAPVFDFEEVRVKVVPLARTNYSYILQDKASGKLAVIDPGDAYFLSLIADTEFHQPISVLAITHKHWDHCAGLPALIKRYPDCKSYSHIAEDAFDITNKLTEGEAIQLGNTEIRLLHTPGHTEGSACFYVRPKKGAPLIFTGDTLFLGGMGAFFEGTARTILLTIEKLLLVPEETMVFPGHEYSDATLKFAMMVEPLNQDLARKCAWVEMRRKMHYCTVPSTMGEERSYNPFLRIKTESVRSATHVHAPVNVLVMLQNFRVNRRKEYKNLALINPEKTQSSTLTT